jgi:hypothetical protein
MACLFAVLLMPGCADKDALPSGVLSREDMQKVLWDMIQADQYSGYLARDSAHINVKLEDLRLYDQVFQLHHISREKFTRSYKYYMTRPDLTQVLLDSMVAMGNRERTEYYSRSVTRPVPGTPPSTIPPAAPSLLRKKADSLHKKMFGPHQKPEP